MAVLQEPIADGKYGQAMVSGVTPCLVTVNASGHQYCEAAAGVTDALSSVALGSIRILWSDAGSGSGSGSGSGAENQWSVVAIGHSASVDASVLPVKLTAKTNDTTYTGNVYGNGTDQAATESAVTIRVEGMASGETLPNAVVFHVARQSWPTIGGGATRTEYWTIIAPPRYV